MNIKSHRMLSPTGKAICLVAVIFASWNRPCDGVSADTLDKTVDAIGGGQGASKIHLESSVAVHPSEIAKSHNDETDKPFTSGKVHNFQFLGRKARPNMILASEDEMLERDLKDGEDGVLTSSFTDPITAMAEESDMPDKQGKKRYLGSSLRRLQGCPVISDTLEQLGVDDTFKNWLQVDGSEVDFLSKLIELYVDAGLDVETGATIQEDSVSNPYPEVCQRLPLFENTCYATQDPDTSFLDLLVANFIPFGEEIIAAKQYVEEVIADISERTEEFMDFFLPDAEEPGQCIVFNEDMIGIAENPGFPPPFIYSLCNCLSMIAYGVEACTVQAYFRGFAMSTGSSGALKYDLSSHLDSSGNSYLYDGFAEYKFAPRGDYWASMDIAVQVPKMFSTFPIDMQSLICKPQTEGSTGQTNFKDIKAVEIKSALLVKKPSPEDSETLVMIVVESVRVTLAKKPFKFLSFSVGNAYGALRLNTQEPLCQPSGLFASINLGTDFALGEGIRKFLNIPNPEVTADLGITWLDPTPDDPADAIQSIFLRLQWSGLSLLGFGIPDATVEIQYFDDLEFQRRRDWNRDICCFLDNVADSNDCGYQVSPITEYITQPDSFGNMRTPQPTLAIFFDCPGNINFSGGIVTWSNILVKFMTSVPENPGDDFRVVFGFELQVDVLYIAALAIEASVETVTDSKGDTDIYAEFYAKAAVNVGVGVATCTIHAKAVVTYLTFDVLPDRALEAAIIENRRLKEEGQDAPPVHRELDTIGGGSLEDADFDLDVVLDFQVAEWVEDLAELVYEGLTIVYQGLQVAWDAIADFAEGLWNDAVALANQIGGAILDGIEAAVDFILDGLGAISDGLNDLVSIFDGTPLGPIAEVIGDLGNAVIKTIETAVELGGAIFTGDWSKVEEIFGEIGAAVADAFGFSKKVKDKSLQYTGTRDSLLNCPLVYWRWTECKRAFGIEYDCMTMRGPEFPEEACAQQKAALLVEMETNIRQGDESEKCRLSSEARSQGVAWVGHAKAADVTAALQVNMANVNQNLGLASTLQTNGACQKIPLTLEVNKLATTSSGTDGHATSEGESNSCIDFTTEADLIDSLDLLKTQASDEIKDLSRGNQGIDKDSTVASCKEKAQLACEDYPPTINPGVGFNAQHTITCDVPISSLQLSEVFGSAVVTAAGICQPSEVQQGFKLKQSVTDEEDGCASTTITFERYGIDCCNQKTATDLTHELIIEVLPPRFTTLTGSIDQTLTCDTNLFPGIEGILTPEWEVGCPDGSIDEDSVDSGVVFDATTCTTFFTRTWTLVQDGCIENAVSFEQKFVLINEYDPEWDYFPPDTTINVFAEYGTAATGFPTVFQKCGASPIVVTYADDIQPGSCFAERILTRTFTAVDICGHTIVRSQTITITNAVDELPLGEKSLAFVYGAKRSRIDTKDEVCLHSSEHCGITAAPNYICGTAPDDEFSDYQDYLDGLIALDVGPTEKSFECPDMDPTCDVRTGYSLENGDLYFYHTQQVNAAIPEHGGIVNQRPSSVNQGSIAVAAIGCAPLNVGEKGKSAPGCTKTTLSGSNEVYNIFRVDAMDFARTNFFVSVPSTSIALVNVDSNLDDLITIDKDNVSGIHLEDNVSAHNLLWNFASGACWRVNARSRPDYSFFGTLLNRKGNVTAVYPNTKENSWTGQIFSNNTNLNKVNLKCGGHFAGFASCENVSPFL